MPTGMRDSEQREKSDFDKGFDAGYKSGREYYANDIALEMDDVAKTLQVLEKYAPYEQTAINELKRTLEVLEVIKIKADSKRYL